MRAHKKLPKGGFFIFRGLSAAQCAPTRNCQKAVSLFLGVRVLRNARPQETPVYFQGKKANSLTFIRPN
jgi:hypothetical protein